MKHKHLTYDDCLMIQQGLENRESLHQIAKRLHKSDSTISREIVRNRYQVKSNFLQSNRTLHLCKSLRYGQSVQH